MNRVLYRVLVYSCFARFMGSVVGLIFSRKNASDLNSSSVLCICLLILSIVSLIIVQCLYRIAKKPLPKGNQTKICPKCKGMNDKDAEYCKYCGNRFRNF